MANLVLFPEIHAYRAIVIDPPWPMQKIKRRVRPNQVEFDYERMNFDEMTQMNVIALAQPDSHLYCWTTHKHLPWAMKLVELWGFRYECLMTWNKNVGFTPYSWMRDTEHVLFCRRGNLPLLKKGVRLSFSAKVREHSRKPDIFYYERVMPVSPGPYIDLFARQRRPGWDVFGDEVDKFDA